MKRGIVLNDLKLKIADTDVDSIRDGYYYSEEKKAYCCLACDRMFMDGEIYQFDNRFYDSKHAVETHQTKDHIPWFDELMNMNDKSLNLTENQKNLIKMIHMGLSDKEIAEKAGLASSTVRHQNFMFREKARQARNYLAVYSLAFDKRSDKSSEIVPIHENATMVDNRYSVTVEEEDEILKKSFLSLSPLKLKQFPPKEKRKIVILRKIVSLFEWNVKYDEKQVNQIIKEVYEDYVTLRRYMIMYGFMDRTTDCRTYWRI